MTARSAGVPRDAATVLGVYVAALLLVPSRLIFKPLGAAGTPATLIGLGALLWWANARWVPGWGSRPATSRCG
jgi:hypothetical protein